jgi:hypothetical protein
MISLKTLIFLFILPPIMAFSQNQSRQLIETSTFSLKSPNFDLYPLNDNDFWEYIVIDSTTFLGVEGLKYSFLKEILGDTLLSNGLTYKIIRWEKYCNSVNEPPFYEFERKDSGKIYIFYKGQDYLLYDFTLPVGSTYPSHYPGLSWQIYNKCIVTGTPLVEIHFRLLDQSVNTLKEIIITEEFGLTYHQDHSLTYYNKINLFGAVINNTTYGYPLAKGQTIDWNEFYPLHVGNLWVYDGHEGFLPYKRYVKIVKDTLMQDGNIYKMTEDIRAGNIPYPSKEIYFQRMDGSGVVWRYGSSYYWHKFSACVGDTFSSSNPDFFDRLDNKNYNELYFFVYPDLVFASRLFIRNLGLYESTIEWGGETLIGAVINGVAYGDTTISAVEEMENTIADGYQLYQNYPNPFNPVTKIEFNIPHESKVTLKIYDTLGREVAVLVNENLSSGRHSADFRAENLAAGVYVYTLISDKNYLSKKMILMK